MIFIVVFFAFLQKSCTFAVPLLRYGVMVALQILALSVRVRVLLSQQNEPPMAARFVDTYHPHAPPVDGGKVSPCAAIAANPSVGRRPPKPGGVGRNRLIQSELAKTDCPKQGNRFWLNSSKPKSYESRLPLSFSPPERHLCHPERKRRISPCSRGYILLDPYEQFYRDFALRGTFERTPTGTCPPWWRQFQFGI